MKKISYPIDKKLWSPSLIPGPIVLISTCNSQGEPNIAPKSWLQMVSFNPPIMMFSGSKGNTTEENIKQIKCFGVNFVDSSIVDRVYNCIKWHGTERIEKSKFELSKSDIIRAPLVQNCKAHLECKFVDSKEIGSGLVIFGEIVASSIWDKISKANKEEAYSLFDQSLFLENDFYCKINKGYAIDED